MTDKLVPMELEVSISTYGHCFIKTGGKRRQYDDIENAKDVGKAVRSFIEDIVTECNKANN
jgi:hypothetical protein